MVCGFCEHNEREQKKIGKFIAVKCLNVIVIVSKKPQIVDKTKFSLKIIKSCWFH